MDDFIQLLIRARKEQGLTQSQVAAAMGVSQPTISGFESGRIDPRLSTIRRYARAVRVSYTYEISTVDSVEVPLGLEPG